MSQALATFGSDFTLIAALFPNKTRRQIKNKYSKESKVQRLWWCMPVSVQIEYASPAYHMQAPLAAIGTFRGHCRPTLGEWMMP